MSDFVDDGALDYADHMADIANDAEARRNGPVPDAPEPSSSDGPEIAENQTPCRRLRP